MAGPYHTNQLNATNKSEHLTIGENVIIAKLY